MTCRTPLASSHESRSRYRAAETAAEDEKALTVLTEQMRRIDSRFASKPVSAWFAQLMYALVRWIGRLHVSGLENLAETQGAVIVCNHVGWADPIWMGVAVRPGQVHQMAKKELFSNPLVAWLVRAGGGFPVDRERPSPATLRYAISLASSGGRVLIFPVGTRKRTGETRQIKRGAALVAMRANVDVIPAVYVGPDHVSWRHLFRRPAIRVHFGARLTPSSGSEPNTIESISARMELAMQELEQQVRLGEFDMGRSSPQNSPAIP